MGCDIHSYAEKRVNGKWESVAVSPFDWRSYGMYGFLADVRNYSAVPPIAQPRGLPEELSFDTQKEYEHWDGDAHTASWLSLAELLAFDYDHPMEDRRVTRQVGPNAWNGGCTADLGEGTMTTYREFLGKMFFADLERLKAAGAERIVFWFDN